MDDNELGAWGGSQTKLVAQEESDISGTEIVETVTRTKDARFWVLFAAVCASEFTRAIDLTVTPILAPSIAKELQISTAAIYSSSSGFVLAQSVIEPLFAALSDAIGRKISILLALGIFAAGSALSALSKSAVWLIIARSVQGIGAGGMDIVVTMILIDVVELKDRATYNAYCQLCGAAGLLSGSMMASGIVTRTSWRWTFWINLPIVFILATIFSTVFRPNTKPLGLLKSLWSVDWIGLASLGGASAALLYASFADWDVTLTKGVLAIGIVGLFLFAAWEEIVERYIRSIQVVFPRRLFSTRTANGGYLLALLQGIIGANFQYFFLTYLYVSKSFSMLRATVVMIPSTIFILGAAAGTGFLTAHLKIFKPFTILGFALLAPSFYVFGTADEYTTIAALVGFQIWLGIATGMTFPGRLLALYTGQREEADEAKAGALGQFFFNLGFCFGIPIGLLIFDKGMGRLLARGVAEGVLGVDAASQGADITDSVDVLAALPPELQSFFRHAVAVATGDIWRAMAAISYAALLVTLCTKNIRMLK